MTETNETNDQGKISPEESLYLCGFSSSRGFPVTVVSKAPSVGVRIVEMSTLEGEKFATLTLPFDAEGHPYSALYVLGLRVVTALYDRLHPITPAPVAEVAAQAIIETLSAAKGQKDRLKALSIIEANLRSWTQPSETMKLKERADEKSKEVSED